jgi:hypothetical protein
MTDIDKMTVEEIQAKLRPDQQQAMACIGELFREIIEAKEPIALACFYIGEKDLLGDHPIYWITNLKDESTGKIIEHAYARFVKTGRIHPTTEKP